MKSPAYEKADVVERPTTYRCNQRASWRAGVRPLPRGVQKGISVGFVWRINKWPKLKEVFWEFDIERLLMMPDDMLERKASDPGIINFSKVKTVLARGDDC